MGIALLGSVMNAAYAPGLASVGSVPAAASAQAANSLGEAYDVAARLGGPVGDALRSAARTAFVHGLHVTLFVSAGLLLLGALAGLRLPWIMDCTVAGPDPAAEPEARQAPLAQQLSLKVPAPARPADVATAESGRAGH